MGNSRIITHEFQYRAPRELSEALALLEEHSPSALIVAGGTDVVPQLKYEVISPKILIDITKIRELEYIREADGLKIGAATKLRDVERFCASSPGHAGLHDALFAIGKVQVMNMGTLAGNLCTASPASDSAPILLVLGARVRLAGGSGERVVDLADFFLGRRRTVMSPSEIMTEIIIPPVDCAGGNAFVKLARVGSDISKLSCAVAVVRDGARSISCKIAMGSIAPIPTRIPEAETLLRDRGIDTDLLEAAGKTISSLVQPVNDVRSTQAYRCQVSAVLFKDTFRKAWQRAGGKNGETEAAFDR